MSTWQQPTKTYIVTYPGLTGEVHLDIIEEKLRVARTKRPDARQSQDFIALQFKKAYELKYGHKVRKWISWPMLRITETPETTVELKSLYPPVPEDRHCCEHDNCTMCDLGAHERCSYGECTLFAGNTR